MAGAYETGVYRNIFKECGYSEEEIEKRVKETFETIFYGSEEERFYHEAGADMGYMEDTGNHDVRTEGMSYGMMVCVQMNRKQEFDRLWKWVRTYMYIEDGPGKNYFVWSCAVDGTRNADGPAPDGEEYFAMALFFASKRWGDGEGIFNYSSEARAILRECVHKGEPGHPGEPMWNPENHYIKFVPGMEISDPSYHLPHFYHLFAKFSDERDHAFWAEAEAASRRYIALCAHPVTGLSPEYAAYDGTPVLMFGKNYAYYSDAYRVIMNIALDTLWNGRTQALCDIATHVQDFFAKELPEENYRAYDLDGTRWDEPAMHPVAITAVNAAGSIASDSETADMWLKRFWELPMRTGKRRYYDNCLYFFSLLMLSGQYRKWVE